MQAPKNSNPQINASTLFKEKKPAAERKISSQARSKITIQSLDRKPQTVYLEHNLEKHYPYGISGRVKKVFDEKGDLIGAVKIMINKDLAIIEANVSVLMPDRTHQIYYGFLKSHRYEKWYVFMPWFEGITILEYNKKVKENKLNSIDLASRLKLFKQALEQVKNIHDNNLIVGDINSRNFIISIEKMQIYLIDLNTTASMVPGNFFYSYKYDMENLGDTLFDLFPDLTDVEGKENSGTIVGKLINYLLKRMTDSEKTEIPNVYQCISKVDQIIEIQNLIIYFSDKINKIFYGDDSFSEKKLSLEGELKLSKKLLKKKLSIFFYDRKISYRQFYHFIKDKICSEVNLLIRKLEKLRVTPVEELTANKLLLFSSKKHSSKPVSGSKKEQGILSLGPG